MQVLNIASDLHTIGLQLGADVAAQHGSGGPPGAANGINGSDAAAGTGIFDGTTEVSDRREALAPMYSIDSIS